MEEDWLFLSEVTERTGLSRPKLRHRIAAYGIPSRIVRNTQSGAQRATQMHESDIPRLAPKLRSEWKKADPLAPPPAGCAYIFQVAIAHRRSPETLRRRVYRWGVPYTLSGRHIVIALADIPRLFEKPPRLPPQHSAPPLPDDALLPSMGVRDGGRCMVKAVAHRFGIDPDRLYSRDRTAPVIVARHIAAAVLRRMGMSIGKIAQHLGRDHSTICNSLFRVKSDKALRAFVEHIVANLPPEGDVPATFDAYIVPVVQARHPQDGAAILAYLRADILHLTTIRADHGARALFALAADPVLIIKLTHLLRTHGQQGAAGVLESRVDALRKVAR